MAVMVTSIVIGLAVHRGSKNDVVEIHPARTVPEMPKSLPPPKDAQARGIPGGPFTGLRKGSSHMQSQSAPPRKKSNLPPRNLPAPAPLSEQKALVLLAQNHPRL